MQPTKSIVLLLCCSADQRVAEFLSLYEISQMSMATYELLAADHRWNPCSSNPSGFR
jgi:hypothetical protein